MINKTLLNYRLTITKIS